MIKSSKKLKNIALSGLCLMLVSCGDTQDRITVKEIDFATQKTLIGTSLREPNWPDKIKSKLLLDLKIAQAVFNVAPDREESFIWLGRRYGYLGRNPEAIEVFTQGLKKFPESYKLRRFRARHLARTRQFEQAISDYKKAVELIANQPDSFEPDGIPNALHLTIGTYKTNIHYYLGQTSFAVGDYAAMLKGLTASMNYPLLFARNDYLVSKGYWSYIALRKMGRHEEAYALIMEIPQGLDLFENATYYKAIQHFQGHYTDTDLLPKADAIIKFAISMKYQFNGQKEKAKNLQMNIVRKSPLGFWPAEVELTRAYQ